jgi:chromosome segregation ATPase
VFISILVEPPTLYQQFDQLQSELHQALLRHRALKTELEKLKSENQQIVVENKSLEDELRDCREALKSIKLAQSIKNGDDQSVLELKKEINRYIREIDKCLNLLNRE